MRVAVTGMGVVSAAGVGVDALLAALRRTDWMLSPSRFLKTTRQVPVGEVPYTNAELQQRYGLDPRKTYSRTSLLGIAAATEALQSANLPKGSRIAFVSSTTVGGMDLTEQFYDCFRHDPQKGRLRMVVHHDSADSTKTIAETLGLQGFATTISTACSSSANAMLLGKRLLETNWCDAVLVGGTDALCKFTLNGFASLMILDNAPCRPFDETRAGLNLGEGAAYLVMQRPEAATHAIGYLCGAANANDAHHQTATSAEGRGAQLAMRKALQAAGLQPSDIHYINAHGTGTPNNDASESAAMSAVFGESVPPFSSTKPITGHCLAAAGSIEAVITLLALQQGEMWPSLNFKQPMSGTSLRPITSLTMCPIRYAMSSSFGFGGNCSTLIFEK
ncbi:MAG: beta-ketoacyl-[acyl-carrier-protein] synthase family protein [Paludibacteraceae bacterium]|nr:beta-ketoacyl-[acyl-carrier-protein] synthase family protein [Paludibacteraceae bacterium]